MPSPTVTFLARPGCHLCDDAREVVLAVVGEFPSVRFVERSIADEAQLLERYAEEIPVVLIDDVVHNIWRVDAERFRRALSEATS